MSKFEAKNFAPEDAEFLVDVYGAFGRYMAKHGQPPEAVRNHIFGYMMTNELLTDEMLYD